MHSITVRKIRLQKIVGRNKIKTILTSSELRLMLQAEIKISSLFYFEKYSHVKKLFRAKWGPHKSFL